MGTHMSLGSEVSSPLRWSNEIIHIHCMRTHLNLGSHCVVKGQHQSHCCSAGGIKIVQGIMGQHEGEFIFSRNRLFLPREL